MSTNFINVLIIKYLIEIQIGLPFFWRRNL